MYKLYEDPGHGWLKVSLTELKDLDILNKISKYSYYKGGFAYLEEDCDLALFLSVKFNSLSDRKDFMMNKVDYIYQEVTSIREYDTFTSLIPKPRFHTSLPDYLTRPF